MSEISVGHSDQRQCFQTIARDHMAVQKSATATRVRDKEFAQCTPGALVSEYDQEPRVKIVATRAHDRVHKHSGATLCGRIGHDRASGCAAANAAGSAAPYVEVVWR